MTEHVQLEIVAGVLFLGGQIITIWRSDVAAKRANEASRNAEEAARNAARAVVTATTLGAVHTAAISEVHEAVNGGMAAGKKEIADLKAEVLRLNTVLDNVKPIIPPIPTTPPEIRLEEIRGQL
jgi:hypothetical protein